MIIWLLIISIWFFLTSIHNIFFVIFSLIKFDDEAKKLNNLTPVSNINFIIVIPVYLEQKIIKATVNFYKNIKYNGNYKIVFISSSREDADLERIKKIYKKNRLYNNKEIKMLLKKYVGNNDLALTSNLFVKKYFDNIGGIKIKTTGGIIDGLVDGKKILHFKTDGSDKVKADQINQFLQKIDLVIDDFNNFNNERTYISIYDCDSRTDSNILNLASNYIIFYKSKLNKFPAGLQQAPIYISNFDSIQSHLSKYRFIYDLYFYFAIEFPTMFAKTKQTGAVVSALCARLIHGVGHGEFFNYYILKKLGFFQPPNGDTDYGYSLCYLSENFLPLPILDVSETPDKVYILIKRGIVWFNGVFLFNENRRIIEKIIKKNLLSIKNLFTILRLTISNIYWMLGPLLIICSMGLSLLIKNYLIFSFLLLGLALNSFPAILVANFAKNNYKGVFGYNDIILSFIYYPLEKIIHSLGPLAWLCLKIAREDLKDLGRLKTKRV